MLSELALIFYVIRHMDVLARTAAEEVFGSCFRECCSERLHGAAGRRIRNVQN